jgi:hypothetical protein
MAEVSKAVASFRARFHAAEEDERLARSAALALSDDARLRECLDLHALNLLIDLERAKERAGVSTPRAVIAQANRERLASAPMPPSLLSRWNRRVDAP